jgi:hypothetical protein
MPMKPTYKIATLDDIQSPVPPDPDSFDWKPIRHHMGISAFGVNAGVARNVGDWVVEEHTERQGGAAGHEELYYVASGHARFVIEGEGIDAPAGTLVFVRDPDALRSAKALEAGTTVLYIGAEPGAAFEVSPWERKYFDRQGA